MSQPQNNNLIESAEEENRVRINYGDDNNTALNSVVSNLAREMGSYCEDLTIRRMREFLSKKRIKPKGNPT